MQRWLLALILCGAVAFAAFVLARDPAPRLTYAQLVAHNYRVLTREQSRTLIRYARRVHACLRANDVPVSNPVVTRTRIAMQAPDRTAESLLESLMECESVGPPPRDATLQARAGQVLVFVPKQCLLDPREVDAAVV